MSGSEFESVQPIEFLSELRGALERVVERAEQSGKTTNRLSASSRRRKRLVWSLVAFIVITTPVAWATLARFADRGTLRFAALTVPPVDPLQAARRLGAGILRIPGPTAYGDSLISLAARAPDDVWAVGSRTSRVSQDETSQQTMQTGLVEHWDGSSWTRVVVPATVALNAAVPVAADDVWVLGGWVEEGTRIERQFFHFDGSSWQFVPSPQPKYSSIAAAAAVSSTDIWAVGLRGKLRPARHSWDDIPLIEHWDGTKWTIVSTPITAGINSGLESVAVRAPDDIWAVGFNDTGVVLKNAGTRYEALVMHWDGTRWSIMPAPDVGDQNSDYRQTFLRQVIVTADGDIAAAGSWIPGDPEKWSDSRPLLVHWDGNGWEQLDTRTLVQQRQREFTCVAALPNGDVLAGGEPGGYAPFVDSSSGGRWSIADATALGLTDTPQSRADVVALAATSVTEAWALVQGGETQPDLNMPAILHWDGTTWRTVQPAPYEAQQ